MRSLVFSLLQVRKVHFDTQDHGPQTITGLEPKEVPLIHQQQGKGSTEWENSHYVSGHLLGRMVSGPDTMPRARHFQFDSSQTASKGPPHAGLACDQADIYIFFFCQLIPLHRDSVTLVWVPQGHFQELSMLCDLE